MKPKRLVLLVCLGLAALPLPARAASDEKQVYIEEMTWLELRERMKKGVDTVIIPTGGTEQNGPHLTMGKHNYIAAYTSGEIARKLGNAVAAPVLAYVPEGRIEPPEGHMRFPGTISVSDEAYAGILEDAARSFKQHGFRTICFIGDHGGSGQDVQSAVAERLSREWRGQGVKVIAATNYYKDNGQDEWAAKQRLKTSKPDAHAGFMDTSEMMALKPEAVRRDLVLDYGEEYFTTGGVAGSPAEARRTAGQKLLSLKVDAAVAQIRHAESRH